MSCWRIEGRTCLQNALVSQQLMIWLQRRSVRNGNTTRSMLLASKSSSTRNGGSFHVCCWSVLFVSLNFLCGLRCFPFARHTWSGGWSWPYSQIKLSTAFLERCVCALAEKTFQTKGFSRAIPQTLHEVLFSVYFMSCFESSGLLKGSRWGNWISFYLKVLWKLLWLNH